jgi:hypothetical protein
MARQTVSSCNNGAPVRVRKGDETIEITLVDKVAEYTVGDPFIGGARQFRDCEFAFVHPKKVNGVLLELIDDKDKMDL